jgi:hypothetical protein
MTSTENVSPSVGQVTQLIMNAVQAVRQSAGPRAADGLLPGRQF